MIRHAVRAAAILIFASLLQSCGGGGDNGGPDPGPDPDPTTRLSVDTTDISVSARPGDDGPRSQVALTVSNPPAEGLFVGWLHSTNGIGLVDFSGISASQGQLLIVFNMPAGMPNGTYEDQIELHVCTDNLCNDDIDGSPVTIRTRYVVSGSIAASIDRNSFVLRTDTQQDDFRTETVRLSIDRAPFGGAYIETTTTGNAVNFVSVEGISPTIHNVQLEFLNGRSMRPGVYDDTVTVTACYDNGCSRQLDGSPFTITTRVTVDTGAEPGVDPLVVLSRATLAHDIVDAAYSQALDAVVMVGTYPADALYVYDVNAGTERQLLLSKTPTSVSVAPNGLSAAVGHDALITVVDLTQVGQGGAPAPTLLDVSAEVNDLMLAANGKVHALDGAAEWQDIHTIDIAANTEALSTGNQVQGGVLGGLHPSGDYIYTVDFQALQKWNLTSDPVAWISSTPFQESHVTCGQLWFKSDGSTIYTACGNTFRSNTDPAQDMVYAGALALSAEREFDWLIKSLSHSSVTGEIALVEAETDSCVRIPAEAGRCYTHLATYESAFLNRQSLHAIGPVTVGERSYAQRGLFVFHDAAGTRRILLSKLDGMPDPDTEYYLSVAQ